MAAGARAETTRTKGHKEPRGHQGISLALAHAELSSRAADHHGPCHHDQSRRPGVRTPGEGAARPPVGYASATTTYSVAEAKNGRWARWCSQTAAWYSLR
ncbi:hypothetical protein GCM10010390_46220 [Streptomyces mordarskii]|uniref:Uncharacterized protein n=1 Tax=Streptomyces mordarskii TaxID=1226758 RepID=A0ABN1DB70_9ACTN